MQVRVGSGVLALALIMGLALAAGTATARERINSDVTLGTGESSTGQEFLRGKVKSPKAKCERNRNVVLYYNDPPAPQRFISVADDASDPNGRWRIEAPTTEIPPGRYYVKVTPITRGGDRCGPAKSEEITVS
jgi:hypothetical protein